METTIDINPTLRITVQKGNFGVYVRIQRNRRWICFSKSLWKIITDALVRLQTIGEVMHLTKTKRLEVINFKEQRYVSFVQQRLDSNIKFYINFNDEEWNKLLENMQTINESIKGCEKSDCDVCKNLKTPIVLQKKTDRKFESKLSKLKRAKLQQYNFTVENPQGLMCLYCGQETQDDCHCHAYNCFMCEPENFCKKCYEITVYPAV